MQTVKITDEAVLDFVGEGVADGPRLDVGWGYDNAGIPAPVLAATYGVVGVAAMDNGGAGSGHGLVCGLLPDDGERQPDARGEQRAQG